MIFQPLDPKEECAGVYSKGEIYKSLPEDLSRTWKYVSYLKGYEVDYAYLYCGGKALDEVCPEELKPKWDEISSKMKAYLRSFMLGKVSLSDNCFFDLVPESFLLKYYDLKNKITQSVFDVYERPVDYDFLCGLAKVLHDIAAQDLNVDLSALADDRHEYKVRQFQKSAQKAKTRVVYNMFGTKTGRLTTCKGSFPILTMSKKYRKVLKPVNDCFVELDFNAAELRVLLALSGQGQPEEDLHEWNNEHVYRGLQDREESKKRIFAWLYNPESKDYLSEKFYHKNVVKEKYYDGEYVVNPFGRKIKSDEFHAVNYIIQSTASDIFLRQMVKVAEQLEGKKSFIAFSIHDSLVLDMTREDKAIMREIHEQFSTTEFGKFKTSLKVGRDFGTMKEAEI